MANVIPPEVDGAAFTGSPAPAGLSAEEKTTFDRLVYFYSKGLGYALEMGNRPQTLYGLSDSPVALAAWILDHDAWSQEMQARSWAGGTEGISRDDALDNMTLYWLTNTGVSSGRLYSEWKQPFFQPKGVKVPVAVSAFPDEIAPATRSWAEKAYPKLLFYKKHDKGGHFAAFEQPAYMIEDIRAGLRSLR